MISNNLTTFGWSSSLKREISRMTLQGTPPSGVESAKGMRLMATISPVLCFFPLYTIPYAPWPIKSVLWVRGWALRLKGGNVSNAILWQSSMRADVPCISTAVYGNHNLSLLVYLGCCHSISWCKMQTANTTTTTDNKEQKAHHSTGVQRTSTRVQYL